MRIFAPFDHGSRSAKARNGCFDLWSCIGTDDDILLKINEAHFSSQLIAAQIQKSKYLNMPFKMIAGDHLNTYFAVNSLRLFYPSLNVVIFDAHHDAYEDTLCHWSFVYHLQNIPGIHITLYGVRYEVEKSALKNNSFAPSAPTYISVDADYFPELKNVGHAVPEYRKETEKSCVERFHIILEELSKYHIVGYDFCEWYGDNKHEGEIIINNIIQYLDASLEADPIVY